MTRQLPVRVGYEYPVELGEHQAPCPHRQGVGMGLFVKVVCQGLR
jgi:hypothetical protein